MKNDKGEGIGRLKIEGGLLTFFPRKGDLIKGGGGGVFEMGGLDRGFMVQTFDCNACK